jgi:NAD(P)-dependent dehydrogenase (short-subunit alcohol dehydrogenase family)
MAHVQGNVGMGAYAASKAAVRSMTRSFAREMIPHGIRVNAVMPGPIDTDFAVKNLDPDRAAEARKWMRSSNPMGRGGRPEEVARAVLFLAFEATFTTGAEIPVDGGASQL